MKHMSPDASGFQRPPNQFGTLQFDDSDRPPPFYRYFVPEPEVLNMLKDATCFARITLARDMEERELNDLLYHSPTMMPYRSFVTYAGRMLLIFSRNREVRRTAPLPPTPHQSQPCTCGAAFSSPSPSPPFLPFCTVSLITTLYYGVALTCVRLAP